MSWLHKVGCDSIVREETNIICLSHPMISVIPSTPPTDQTWRCIQLAISVRIPESSFSYLKIADPQVERQEMKRTLEIPSWLQVNQRFSVKILLHNELQELQCAVPVLCLAWRCETNQLNVANIVYWDVKPDPRCNQSSHRMLWHFYIFTTGSLWTFICHCYWEGQHPPTK